MWNFRGSSGDLPITQNSLGHPKFDLCLACRAALRKQLQLQYTQKRPHLQPPRRRQVPFAHGALAQWTLQLAMLKIYRFCMFIVEIVN